MTGGAFFKLCGMCVAVLAAGSVQGAEWFVDSSRPDDTGSGTSVATAKRTIQAAVDAAAAGDTVTVLPGMYDEGGATFTANSVVCSNRVYITKNLTLRSRDGAATTHIVGRKDPDSTSYGIGPGAIRCIAVKNDGPQVAIEGFTLRDGSTRDGGDSVPVRGGAVLYTADSNTDKARAVTVRDCVIRDCSGTRGGAIYGVTAERCTFTGNYGKNFGAAARQCHLRDCVLYRNLGGSNVGVLAYGYTAVNCTIAYNEPVACFTEFDAAGRWASNCLVRANGNLGISSKLYSSLTDGSLTVNGCRTMPTGEPLFVAPAAGDFRLNVDAAAVTNNPADGVYCGAVQKAVACTGGKLVFRKPSTGSLYVNGVPVLSEVYAGASPWPTSYAVTYEAPAGKGLVRFSYAGNSRWPGMDEVYYAIPPVSGSAEIAPVSGAVKYVSPDGDDATGDGSSEAPYRTLQGAVDAVGSSATLLYAKAGIYDDGGAVSCGISNRLVFASGRSVRVKALEGPAKTIIQGAPDPAPTVANDYGLGLQATRCLCFNTHGCAVQGFTVTGGRTSVNANNGDGTAVRGGAMHAFDGTSSYASAILDCVVSNNVASRGSVNFGGYIERCLLVENVIPSGGNGITRACSVYSSVYTRNRSANTIVGQTTHAYNCTVVSNYSANVQVNTDTNTKLDNVVLAANAKANDVDTLSGARNTVFEKGTVAADTCVQATTLFADYLHGDFRPYAACVASHYGDPLFWADGHCFTDFYGRPFNVSSNGRITAGAVSELVPSINVVERVPGSVTPNGIVTEFPVTIAVHAGGRQLLGFEVNGTTQTVAGTSLTLTAEQVAGFSDFTVQPILSANWYVDAVNGNDENSGVTPETAKKTLAAAMRLAWSGDTVYALPGIYNEGEMLQDNPALVGESLTTNMVLSSRVVVQTNVMLVAVGSVDETVIEGRAADPSDSPYYEYAKLGLTGLRAVYLNQDSVVKGFTIRYGSTGYANDQDDNNRGGGVHGRSNYARCHVQDCIISDCGGWRGAAGYFATFTNCRFMGNRAAGNSALGRYVALYGCYASGNCDRGGEYGGLVQYHGDIVGCTFAANNGVSGSPNGQISQGRLSANQMKDAKFWNNVVAMPYSSSYPHMLSNACCNVFSDATRFDVLEGADNIVTNLEAIALGTDGVPQYGSVAINAGDWSYAETNRIGEVALNGVDRGLGGNRPDIGAFAFDWLARFAQDLGGVHLFVTAADRAVLENADGKVEIPEGALAVTWNPSSGTSSAPCSFKANVTGGGTLTVTKNGEALGCYAAGAHDVSFFGVNPVELEFVYTPGTDDSGAAVLSDFRSANGTLFILR